MAETLKGMSLVVAREYSKVTLGAEKTQKLLEECGLAGKPIIVSKDYPNQLFFSLITLIGREQGIDMFEILLSGGRFFAANYAPENYNSFYVINNTIGKALNNFQRLFALATEGREIGNYAAITTEWVDDDTVRIRYDSPLQNTSYPRGLAEGLGDYYNRALKLRELSEIEFSVRLRE